MLRLTLTTLFLTASTYGGPWRTLMPETSSSSTYNMEVNLLTGTDHHARVSCTANGIFQIPGSCQSFYQCDDWDGLNMKMYFFICPPGTIFDDRLSICNDPSLVKITPVCEGTTGSADLVLGENVTATQLTLNTIQNRIKRSLLTEEDYFNGGHEVRLDSNETLDVFSSTGEDTVNGNITSQLFNTTGEDIETPLCDTIVEEEDKSTESQLIGNNALLACKQMFEIDQYVAMVNSMVPVMYPDFMRKVFNGSVVDDYNAELKEAQIHTNPWRRGDSIVNGFRRTFELAKLFGPELVRKYGVSQDRINMLKNMTTENQVEEEIRKDILYIEKEIGMYFNLAQQDPETFLPMLDDKRKQLKGKEAQLSVFISRNRELEEIIAFLQLVKTDVGNIMEKANATKQKMLSFKDSLIHDQQSFQRSKIIAKIAFNVSISEIELTMERVDLLLKKLKQLEDKERKYEDIIRKQENRLDDEMTYFKKQMNRYAQRQEEADRLAEEGAREGLAGYNCFFGLIYCGGSGDEKANRAREMVRNINSTIKLQMDSFNTVYESLTERISLSETSLSLNTMQLFELGDKIVESKSEALSLEYVGVYMGILIEESEKILPYIADAILGLNGLLTNFGNLVFGLESMILQAQYIKDPAERRDFKQFFLTNMTMVLNQWNESYSDIISVGSCTNPEFYSEVTEMLKARGLSEDVTNTQPSCNITTEATANITTDFEVMFPNAGQGDVDYNLIIPISHNDY